MADPHTEAIQKAIAEYGKKVAGVPKGIPAPKPAKKKAAKKK